MILYHGSNVAVKQPEIRQHNRAVDFGGGFYTTTNRVQADRWARRVARLNGGSPTVSVYEFDANLVKNLRELTFPMPNEAWLQFVSANRNQIHLAQPYDLVIGPVANDDVFTTLQAYFAGVLDAEETLKRLKIKDLFDQYVFKTTKALDFLKFTEYREVSDDSN
ncbi:hypothetical protein AGMMS49965_14440 [Bacteroidia bacterium]|nr:hypothetical protein AGMMS49965_14440 [Bacteroidia bacterium]